jgi:hypothetical protein
LRVIAVAVVAAGSDVEQGVGVGCHADSIGWVEFGQTDFEMVSSLGDLGLVAVF